MSKNDEFTVDTAAAAEKQITQEPPVGIQLSDAEKALIKSQREDIAKLTAFREGYQTLIKETGFAWGVDMQSPLGAPKIGVTKVN